MENEALTTLARKRARITAVVLGASAIICLLFLIYAFIQKADADTQRQIATELRKENEQLRKLADEFRIATEQEKLRMAQALQDALQSSQREMEDAAKRKK